MASNRADCSVFNTMFCGLLAESGDAIKIPDIEEEIFTHMLRYLYTGNCDITPDTVISLMYAASKYDVANLVSECSNYLKSNITLRNVFIIFEQAQIFNNKTLNEACIRFMNRNIKACLESDGFISLSKQMLCAILSSNKLDIPEEDVYSACVKWAKEECRRTDQDPSDANCREALGDVVQQDPSDVNCREALGDVVQLIQDPTDANCREALGDVVQQDPSDVNCREALGDVVQLIQDPTDANCREALGDVVQQDPSDANCREALGDVVQDPSDANCREALGDVVQLIRFPLMPMNTFSWTVSTENILTTEEKVSLFQYFAGGDKKTAHSQKIGMFSCKPRFMPKHISLKKYGNIGRIWPSIGDTDAISFYSSKDAVLKGVGLYLPCDKGTTKGKYT